MTPEQADIVKRTFMKIQTGKADPAELFYKRLFEMAPEVRSLFSEDLENQKTKFTMTLQSAILNLHSMEILIPSIQALGRRHLEYGVSLEQFGAVKNAFFWTLENTLGTDYTPETRAAWLEAYNAIEQTMKEAMGETHVLET